ncbi:hypothetical protein GM528_13410, partial [Streptococcus pneumoniae]|nr:hypothetical protein [Streptococcus pneumoniae]
MKNDRPPVGTPERRAWVLACVRAAWERSGVPAPYFNLSAFRKHESKP